MTGVQTCALPIWGTRLGCKLTREALTCQECAREPYRFPEGRSPFWPARPRGVPGLLPLFYPRESSHPGVPASTVKTRFPIHEWFHFREVNSFCILEALVKDDLSFLLLNGVL